MGIATEISPKILSHIISFPFHLNCLESENESISCLAVSDSATPWTVAHQVLCPWDSPGENAGVGRHFLLPDSGIKPRLPPLHVDSLPSEPPGKARGVHQLWN